MHRSATEIITRAESVLGAEAIGLYLGLEGVRLRSNRDVQISVFLATQMHLAALGAEGIDTPWSVGLSLGEYSHLVHIGALTFEAALTLVAARGAAYDTASPGVMVTVLGADRADVEAAVAAVDRGASVVVSNYNAPMQHVLAGTRDAVDQASRWLEDECGAHVVETESRVPMHSPLLEDVAARFRPHLDAAPWQQPRAPYIPNVTARALAMAAPSEIIDHLTRHVTHPVRWQESIEAIAADHPEAIFIEVGPGEVLFNMLGRRWLPVRRARTDDRNATEPATHFRATMEMLRG